MDGNPEDIDWERGLKNDLRKFGLSEETAEATVIAASVTPPGMALDVGQGLYKAGNALGRGDTKAALGHLGTAGMDAAKVKKIGTFLQKGGEKARRALIKAFPDSMSVNMAQDLAKKGLGGKIVTESLSHAFKNGLDPKEALAYGVFSAHAKDTLAKATNSILGKGRDALKSAVSKEDMFKLRQRMGNELVKSGASFLKDVNKEVQSRMVENVLRDIFKPKRKKKE